MGLFGNWKRLVDRTKEYAAFYPHILAHSLWVENRVLVPSHILEQHAAHAKQRSENEAQSYDSYPLVQWVTSQGIRHLSMCALAAQSCQADVEEVDKQERQRIMDATVARLASAGGEEADE